MPQGNGMGPTGMGPMTGRAAGFCADNGQAGFASAGAGRGGFFGRGRGLGSGGFGRGLGTGGGGFGRGYRNMFFATGLPGWMRAGGNVAPASSAMTETEKQGLKNHAAALQSEMELIKQRLSETETK